jgi:hypothetical protein
MYWINVAQPLYWKVRAYMWTPRRLFAGMQDILGKQNYRRLRPMQITNDEAMLLYCLHRCGPEQLDQWQAQFAASAMAYKTRSRKKL